MEVGEKDDKGVQAQNPNQETRGRSCKGCLYHSSILKSKSQNPRCVGISRTLQQVPSYIVGESELEASKEGRSLTDFKYACVGYSVYLDKRNQAPNLQEKQVELPFCVGIELLLDKRPSTADNAPAHIHRKEDSSQPRTYKPAQSMGADYLNRFMRNASLVASGVAKNVNKVGSYIKHSVDDILYPYRRGPK